MDEADLCAVCNNPGQNFYAKEKKLRQIEKHIAFFAGKPPPIRKSTRLGEKYQFPEETESTSFYDLPDHQRLQAQLRRIFLLQQIFEYPVQDVTTLETLQIVGNPSKWFEICLECSLLVDTGIEVLRKLKKYEREHKRVNDILKRKLLDSTNGHQSLDAKHQSILEQRSQQQDPEVSRTRVEFRNKIRNIDTNMNLDIDIKNEPADLTDYENDYPTFDAGFEDIALSPEGPNIRKKSSRKRKTIETIRQKETGENTQKGGYGYSKRTRKAIKKSKNKLTSQKKVKVIKQRTTFASLRAQKVEPLEKPLQGRKRTRTSYKFSDEEEEDTPTPVRKDDGDKEDPDFSFSEDEDDPEEIKWQEKYLQRNKPERIPFESNDSAWFFDKCPEYLDMSLIEYSPEITPKDTDTTEGPSTNRKYPRFPCTSCDKTFCSKFYAIAHIHRVHLGVDKPWSCNMCSRKFQKDRTFRHHILEHNKGILKTCEICHSYATSGQRKYDVHVINHQKTAPTPTCHICQNSFESFGEYVKHATDQHKLMYSQNEDDVKSKCDLCSKLLGTEKQLKYHLFKKHNVGENDGAYPICPECGETFFDENCINNHKRWKHTTNPPEDTKCFCEHCGKEFNATGTLNAHIARVHIEEPQNCKVCGLEIKNKGKLESHMKAAHKETNILSQEELEDYVRKKNEEMAYRCGHCSERFAFNVQLYHHYRSSHPEVTDRFKCDICGKRFSRQSSVKRHMECNHMKVMVRCEDCGKEFAKGDSLKQHRRYHCTAKRRKDEEQARLISTETTEVKHDATFPVPNVGYNVEVDAEQVGPIILYPFMSQNVMDN